ncbi:DUF1642 domain-containing protein [Enterococcus avium]|uniref:DUF1642 domain-containing protein n=1 Tax=Enterococcus avium TaxID=33945 RepID=UPI00288E4D92|nr:DUF1642 domain-containing protein [Enterococcus avium]MDT2457553.1 DUF1642 domain-containing protein [Enterococcus avium]
MYIGGGAEFETTVVDSKRLRRLISKMDDQPEPQKVKVPKLVAEWFEKHKHRLGYSIWKLVGESHKSYTTNKLDMRHWILQEPNNPIETLIRMKDGYEVEKEPLYTVTINLDRKYHLVLDEGDGDDEISTTLTTRHGVLGYRYFLTEKEIKSIDERYWPFAVPVKASVEDYEVEEEPKRWVVRQGGSEVWYLQGFRNSLDGDIVKQWCNHEGCIKFTDKSKAEAVATLVEGSMEEV